MTSRLLPFASTDVCAPYDRAEPSVFDLGLSPSPDNNGQYTGATAREPGVAMRPTAEYLHRVVLPTCDPPPGAAAQPASEWRPGNNEQGPPGPRSDGAERSDGSLHSLCALQGRLRLNVPGTRPLRALDAALAGRQHTARRVLDTDVGVGGGVRLWTEYFPRAQVVGCERRLLARARHNLLGLERVTLVEADPFQPETLPRLGRFDVIVVGGPRSPTDLLFAAQHFPALLEEGGVLILEAAGECPPEAAEVLGVAPSADGLVVAEKCSQ